MRSQTILDKKVASSQIIPSIKLEDEQVIANQLSGICLFVTSTFGNGDPPKTGETLAHWIDDELTKKESKNVHRLSIDHDALDSDQAGNILSPGKTINRRLNNVVAGQKFLGDLM